MCCTACCTTNSQQLENSATNAQQIESFTTNAHLVYLVDLLESPQQMHHRSKHWSLGFDLLWTTQSGHPSCMGRHREYHWGVNRHTMQCLLTVEHALCCLHCGQLSESGQLIWTFFIVLLCCIVLVTSLSVSNNLLLKNYLGNLIFRRCFVVRCNILSIKSVKISGKFLFCFLCNLVGSLG